MYFVTRSNYHNYLLLSVCVLMLLSIVSCGGGGSSEVKKAPIPPTASEPLPCINEIYLMDTASDDGSFTADYSPALAIDLNSSSISRWSSDGTGKSLILDLGNARTIGSLAIKWFKGAERKAYFVVETSLDNSTWQIVQPETESSGRHSGFELVKLIESQARYIKIIGLGNNENDNNGIVEVQANSCPDGTGDIIDLYPHEVGIELIDWYLSVPTDEDNNGKSDSISETKLATGYTNSEYFYASSDNGIVMRSPSYGFKTSANTNYVRVELREMLRRGERSISTQGVNKNNWVFASASADGQQKAGGVDGDLRVTLAVNQVTTTGENYQVGRLVIGQIHSNDDEPIRLYYRKLPNNSKGSIYFAHESRAVDNNGDKIESYVELIGSRSNTASDPADGIALDEKFSYHIAVNVNLLTVTISREGKADIVANYDMSQSLYDQDGQYHYFKVGVYHLNNSSDPGEYAQATFYEIKNSHIGYSASE